MSPRSLERRAAASAAALAFGLLLSAGAEADVKIGFHAPLTGFAASDGKSARIAAEIAVDDLNRAGGLLGEKVTLVTYDDQAQGTQAVPIANRLIGQDQVQLAISGSYSEPTRAAATVFQEAHIPYFAAYSVHPDVTKAGDFVFRGFHLGPPQGRATARFIAETLKAKRVSIVTINNDYGVSNVEGFKEVAGKLGLTVLGEYSYSPRDRQFGSIVASVKRDNPEVVYITGYAFTGGPLTAQLRSGGVKAPIVGSQAFDSQNFMEIAGAAAEGVYVVNALSRDNPDPAFRHFMDELTKRQGTDAESVAAAVYSAVMITADAVKRAGSADPVKLRDAIAATKDFPAMHGRLAGFDASREILMAMPVVVVKDGKFVHVADVEDPMAPAAAGR